MMNVILAIIGITTLVFTATMVWLYLLTGGIPDTLVTMWFTYILGECGVMGLIKVSKNWEHKRLEKAEEEERKKKEIAESKSKLVEMAMNEEGK